MSDLWRANPFHRMRLGDAAPDRIERFGVPQQDGTVGAVVHEAQPGDAEQAKVTLIRDGLTREITFLKGQPSILDCASAAGLEVPFSCTSGVCR